MNGNTDIFFIGDKGTYKYDSIYNTDEALITTHKNQELDEPFIPEPRPPRKPKPVEY